MVNAFAETYKGKRILLTGHTGFKGGWMSLWLKSLDAQVTGFSLPPPDGPNFFGTLPLDCFEKSVFGDLRDSAAVDQIVTECRADIVFHLAAQPLVGVSYREPVSTFMTNAIGTLHLLEALRKSSSPAAVVIVTSDKCYRNNDDGRPFRESDPLGGKDVYSMSKAVTELIANSWHTSFFSQASELGPIATGRAGNVIGGGDYAEDRIVPDAVRAYLNGQPISLRNPLATRPWQHVLESVSGYLALGKQLIEKPDNSTCLSLNFGPCAESERSVGDLLEALLSTWPGAFDVNTSAASPYSEAARLSLDPSKAKEHLGWQPVWDFSTTVAKTAEWYRLRHESSADSEALLALSLQQISDYTEDARALNIPWAY